MNTNLDRMTGYARLGVSFALALGAMACSSSTEGTNPAPWPVEDAAPAPEEPDAAPAETADAAPTPVHPVPVTVDAGPPVPSTMSCGIDYTTAACATCATDRCCSAETACSNDAACKTLLQCMEGCNSSTTCEQSCEGTAGSTAVTLLEAVATCVSNDCATPCDIAPPPPPQPTCKSNGTTCSNCDATLCCATLSACSSNASCVSLSGCLSKCTTTACENACEAEYPGGISPLSAELSCLQQNCSSQCGG